jgi:hypothetical protein
MNLDAHPLLESLLQAAGGVFPPVDGKVTHHPALAGGSEAVVSFTGHAIIASRLGAADLSDLELDGFGAALHPSVLLRMAGPRGWIGVIDVTLAARGTGRAKLAERHDLEDHHRVVHARSLRSDVGVYGDERGLVTVAAGLAGRREISIEVTAGRQGRGWGPSLLADALGLVPAGEPVFAGVSPGNARSLRLFLGAGFVPLGSETILRPRAGRAADADE